MNHPPRSLLVAIRLAAAISAAALLSSRELLWIFVIGSAIVFGFGLWLQRKLSASRFIGRFQPLFALLAFLVSVYDFFAVSGSFLLAVAHFLFEVQSLRLLSLRSVRDNLGSLVLSSMMILSAATLSVEWTFFAYLCAFVPVIIWALMLLNLTHEGQIIDAQRRKEQNGELTDKELKRVHAGLWETHFADENSGRWHQLPRALRLSSGLACSAAALCCAIVFIAFPRFNFQGFRGQYLQPVHKTGYTTNVNLQKSSRIFVDDTVVMRVEIDPADKFKWTGYLRGTTLDLFDGSSWKRSTNDWQPVPSVYGQVNVLTGETKPEQLLRQNIYLESMESPVLFAAPLPVQFKVPRPLLLKGWDGSFQRNRGDMWRLHYSVTSRLPSLFPADAKSGTHVRKHVPNFALSDVPVDPRVTALAKQIVGRETNSYQQARLIANYLATNYQYDLNPNAKRSTKPLEEFLFTTRKGACEHFASAMCVMLRSLKIPTRLTTGFLSNEWNERGSYFVVRMKDAHAWVEAYIDPMGWTQFDPTPRDNARVSSSSWLGHFREMADYVNLRWNRYILSYDMERQAGLVSTINERSKRLTVSLEPYVKWFSNFKFSLTKPQSTSSTGQHLPVWFSSLILFLIPGVIGFFFWSRKASLAKNHGVWFYAEFIRLLECLVGPKKDSQTVNEYISISKTKLSGCDFELSFLSETYNQLRFGSSSVIVMEQRRKIKSALETIKKEGGHLS